MIGSGLKKLAQENGMKVAAGVAYGSLGGFAATLSEGAGWKQIVFATRFPDAVKKTEFMEQIGLVDLKKQYRVQNLGAGPRSIQVIFHDNPGTMKKIREFLDFFLPLLTQYGATGATVCTECGTEITSGKWLLVNGVAYYFHDSCAEKTARDIEADNQQQKDEATGSYLTGLLGALGGSVIGAVAWAIVLNLGYVASLVGLLIGWLAEKGYRLMKGKQGKAKVLILIVAIILGVVLGTVGGDVMTLAGMMNNGELPGFVFADIPWFLATMWAESPEYRQGMISNIGMGLLFAALGVYAILKKAGQEVAGTKVVELK